MRDVRLLPLVIVAISALLALKGIGLVFDRGPILGGAGVAVAQEADGEAGDDAMAAQDEGAQNQSEVAEAGEEAGDGGEEGGNPSMIERVLGGQTTSRDAILESLAERRKVLEARSAELDLRENLLKAAEQRVEERIAELKLLEERVTAAEKERHAKEDARFAGLVTMYEAMKPKDAARIFNDLDLAVVVKVASLMKARQMSAVLAEMESDVAQRLTVALSAEPVDPLMQQDEGGELPQIVGTQPAN